MLLEGYFHISMLHHSIKDCCFGVDSDGHIKDKSLRECIRKQSAFIADEKEKIYVNNEKVSKYRS
jgi:hypothetical protein